MLNLLSRKEVCVTYSMQRQTDVRRILEEHQIHYTVKVDAGAGRNVGVSRVLIDRAGERPELATEYRFFVHKNDYEKAMHVLG